MTISRANGIRALSSLPSLFWLCSSSSDYTLRPVEVSTQNLTVFPSRISRTASAALTTFAMCARLCIARLLSKTTGLIEIKYLESVPATHAIRALGTISQSTSVSSKKMR